MWRTLECWFFAVSLWTLVGLQDFTRAADVQSGLAPAARPAAAELRRQWLRDRLLRRADNPRHRQEVEAQLAGISDEKVQELISAHLGELSRQQQSAVEARRRQLDEGRQEADPPGRAEHGPVFMPPVGFFPMISVLPEGIGLTASAVISPDGRYVAMSLFPFISYIGPVETFNFCTGETRRWPPYGGIRPPHRTAETRHEGPRTRAHTHTGR